MKDDECCGVSEDVCDERRETCKEARIARDIVIMEATKETNKRIEKIEARFDQILIAILIQLIAFFVMVIYTKI